MVESQIVILAVAGSNPVGHPNPLTLRIDPQINGMAAAPSVWNVRLKMPG